MRLLGGSEDALEHTTTHVTFRALEDAGIPVLPIEADVVDARDWNADAARADVRSFLDTRVLQ